MREEQQHILSGRAAALALRAAAALCTQAGAPADPIPRHRNDARPRQVLSCAVASANA